MHIAPTRRSRVLAAAAGLVLALSGCSLVGGSDGGGSGDKADPVASAGAPGAPGAPGTAPGSPSAPGDPSEAAAPAGKPGMVTLAFAGDVHFNERTVPRLNAGAETALGPISKTLGQADIAMVNFESAITERGTPEDKTYHFRAPATALKELQKSGIDVVTMANNHAVDYGPVGLQDSLAAVKNPPIPVVGIGPDATSAYRPWITDVRGTKVAVLAASQVQDITNQRYAAGPAKPGIASALQADRLVKAVKDAKAQAPVVVVYLHWGIEGDKCPSADQKGLAKKLADAGATAVVGTHAHVMQGAGMLGGTYVGYGFGNFLWYGTSPYPDSNDTGVTTLTITDGKVVKEAFAPASVDSRGVPVPQTGAEAKRIADRRDSLRPCTGLAAPPR
ncbi:CapA family protein [Yinghuangia seranimata]|uniref:CapA family protein n=1 Tax=Yinghuangia seranimata TaxID=408067 RepID=UPI00248AB1BA|nr:CapA family protein [Yinghuangia seranimata]MDI2132675.1 CapA family protein [Yinghuangia seranimata]